MATTRQDVHYPRIPLFFGTAAGSSTSSLPGAPGYRIVIDSFRGRMNGGTATGLRINASDSFHGSMGAEKANPIAAGQLVNVSVDEPHKFGEGRTVQLTVDSTVGTGAATSTDGQLEYHYEPSPVGVDG